MGKFKVGDRVRCVARSDWGSKGEVGEVYTVTDILKSGDVELDGSDSGVMTSRFELVANDNSPVRTVTRREIVPGVYGEVSVERIPFSGFEISYSSYGNAHKLRTAARIFNEIADVLDENAEVKKEAA